MGELLTDLVKDIRRLFMLVYSGQCNTMADAIAKDAFIDALWDSRRPSRLQKGWNFMRRRSSLRTRMGSNPNDLAEPGNLFQVYCEFVTLNQDCYQSQASN